MKNDFQIIFFILLAIIRRIQSECSVSLNNEICVDTNLHSIENTVSEHISTLTVSHLTDKILPRYKFDNVNLKSPTIMKSKRMRLESLTITESDFEHIDPRAFTNFECVVEIRMNDNRIHYLDQRAFDGIECLETLSLKNNGLNLFPNKVFNGTRHLRKFELMEDELQTIDFHLLKHVSVIDTLNLTSNSIRSLIPTDCESNIKTIDMRLNSLNKIEQSYFRTFPLLRALFLQSNKIDFVDEYAFKNNTLLEILDLSDNRILRLAPNTFSKLFLLKTLDLSNNPIKILPDVIFGDLAALESLSISGYCLQFGVNYLKGTRRLRKLESTNVTWMGLNRFTETIPYIENIRMEGPFECRVSNRLETHHIFSSENVRSISLYRIATVLTHENLDRITIEYLEMKRCDLSRLPLYTFKAMDTLEHLDMSGNDFRVGFANDLFVSQSNLRTLILTACGIRSLNQKVLSPLVSLEYININNNQLVTLEYGMFQLPSLRTIALSGNAITALPINLLNENCFVENFYVQDNRIKNVPRAFFNKTYLKKIDLRGNPIYCDCIDDISRGIQTGRIRSGLVDTDGCDNDYSDECSPKTSLVRSGAGYSYLEYGCVLLTFYTFAML